MTAAVLGLAGMFSLALGGVIAMCWRALSAEKRAGEQKARADMLDVNLTSVAGQLADAQLTANRERDRADRLYDIAIQAASAAPVAGSLQRLLQTEAATHGNDQGAVPDRPRSESGPDALLDPWERD